MSAILQFNLPTELQDLIRSFVHYSKVEHIQRKKKKRLIKQLGACERLHWHEIPLYDYFYFKVENWDIRVYEKDVFFITQKINLFSCIFCKECHDYLYTNTHTPQHIMCGCLPILLDVD